MITEHELKRLVSLISHIETDTKDCVFCECIKKVPENLIETICAFANQNGGLILFGLSKKNGVSPIRGFDADSVYRQMTVIGDNLSPRIRPEIAQYLFEGSIIVAARIPPVPARKRPCYITARGLYKGAYIRSGTDNRQLTSYETDRLAEGRVTPKHDLEPIEEATLYDLNQTTLNSIVQRARQLHPDIFSKCDPQALLIQIVNSTP